MSIEREFVSQRELGALGGCLAEQRRRERSIRRRSLVISVVLQAAALTALVVVPLLSKPQRIVLADFTPVPPYYHAPSAPQRTSPQPPTPTPTGIHICLSCSVPVAQPGRNTPNSAPQPPGEEISIGDGPNSIPCPACIRIPGREGPKPPTVETQAQQRTRLIVTHIDPAMLIHRVEPVYPTLARQVGRAGRVELRAIIAEDGTIQSLQVVSGDPFFVQSAIDAVRQWRYRPTYLNGKPVEVDTFITVIYNVNR